MGTIASKWNDYSKIINLIKGILPEFKSEKDHLVNKHALDSKTLGELIDIRSKLQVIEVEVKGVKIKGLMSIHQALSLLAEEENFDLTEFNTIYHVLENTLDEYIAELNSISSSLLKMAEEISLNKLSEIKHKHFRTLPDNHHDYNKDLQEGFVEDFKNKMLPDLLSQTWTIKNLKEYTSLMYSDKIVDELYS
jgi:hypothetical protein